MRVLHIVATQERRGAELFASALVGALMGEIDQSVAALGPAGPDPVAFHGARVASMGTTARPRRPVDLHRISALRRHVARIEPDVLVAHGGEPLKYALAATRGDGSRVVYRRIGDRVQFDGHRLQERVFARMVRRCARVVAVADSLRQELTEHYRLRPERVIAIPNAVDPRTIEPTRATDVMRTELDVPPGASVVLSLGALTWEKDPEAHVAIARRAVAMAGVPVVHLFAGDGPLRERLARSIPTRTDGYDARILGSRADVGDLLCATDVMLLASRTEGMPACVIEAGLAGVAVAGFALSGVPEVVLDGVTGELVPAGADAALSVRLADLLRDPERRKRLGARAAERCRERFTIEALAPRYLEVFEAVATGGRR